MSNQLEFRTTVSGKDPAVIAAILESTGFFYDFEIRIACEIAGEYLEKGEQSGYRFVFAELQGRPVGFCIFGEIPCTRERYDLYWIGVHKDFQNRAIGKSLLARSEETMAAEGACKVYIETSSRPIYESTRQFYLRTGYRVEAILQDFYADGDSKYIFVKDLP